MKVVFAGLGITLVIVLLLCNGFLDEPGQEPLPSAIYYVCGISWAISLIGTLLMLKGYTRLGGVLTDVGAIIFVPIGIITMIGVKQVMQQESSLSLDERRKLAAKQD